MMTSTDQAHLFLADQRECVQSPDHRSFQTFALQPFGNLISLHDDTLRSGCSQSWHCPSAIRITVLPLVGAVHCTTPGGAVQTVEAGQVFTFCGTSLSEFVFRNHYEHQLINYLHFWTILPDDSVPGRSQLRDVDLDRSNILIPALFEPHGSFLIGKFDGRIDSVFTIQNPERGIFVFSLEGTFEVKGRLLDSRDGLALRGTDSVEFEALSPEGLLLIYEQHR